MGDENHTHDALMSATNLLGDHKSWVELQDMLPHPNLGVSPDVAVANGARVSFLGESKGQDADRKLIMYLLQNLHTSPFEQVEFKFRVKAPVVVWWQWVRHRTWHFNFQSGRYTPFEDDSFHIPMEWRRQSASNKQGSEGTVTPAESAYFSEKLEALCRVSFEMYQEALTAGVAKEQARLFLPAWGSYYIAICKVDAWNLMHFLRLRMADDAQWEIRQYANAIYTMFNQYMPWTAKAFAEYLLK